MMVSAFSALSSPSESSSVVEGLCVETVDNAVVNVDVRLDTADADLVSVGVNSVGKDPVSKDVGSSVGGRMVVVLSFSAFEIYQIIIREIIL